MTRAGEGGFSLIEVLAAITLMAISAMLISQALRFGVTASDRLTLRAENLTSTIIARRTLTRLVARALPPDRAVFDGGPTRLRFARQAAGAADPGPLVLAEIKADGSTLVLTECAAVRAAGRLSCENQREERLRLDFGAPVKLFYRARSGGGSGSWRKPDQLPALLVIEGAGPPLAIPFHLGDRT